MKAVRVRLRISIWSQLRSKLIKNQWPRTNQKSKVAYFKYFSNENLFWKYHPTQNFKTKRSPVVPARENQILSCKTRFESFNPDCQKWKVAYFRPLSNQHRFWKCHPTQNFKTKRSPVVPSPENPILSCVRRCFLQTRDPRKNKVYQKCKIRRKKKYT